MPKILTQQQVDEYREQGFLSPVDVMSEDEASRYARQLQAAEPLNAGDTFFLQLPRIKIC